MNKLCKSSAFYNYFEVDLQSSINYLATGRRLDRVHCQRICTSAKLNKTPAEAFTPPAKTKMGTRPDRAVTREFIGGGVYSLISVLLN